MTKRDGAFWWVARPVSGPGGLPSPSLLSSPLSFSIALLFVVVGIGTLRSPDFADAVGAMPSAILGGWTVVGGLLILAGLLWRGPSNVTHAIERAGHYLSAAAWISTTAIIWANVGVLGDPHFGGLQALILAAGCLGRARALIHLDRAIENAEEARLRLVEEDSRE